VIPVIVQEIVTVALMVRVHVQERKDHVFVALLVLVELICTVLMEHAAVVLMEHAAVVLMEHAAVVLMEHAAVVLMEHAN
jgi:hypothetical protein